MCPELCPHTLPRGSGTPGSEASRVQQVSLPGSTAPGSCDTVTIRCGLVSLLQMSEQSLQTLAPAHQQLLVSLSSQVDLRATVHIRQEPVLSQTPGPHYPRLEQIGLAILTPRNPQVGSGCAFEDSAPPGSVAGYPDCKVAAQFQPSHKEERRRWLFSFTKAKASCSSCSPAPCSYLGVRGRSVKFSHSVISSSLQPHGLQHARLPCSSPTSRACSN